MEQLKQTQKQLPDQQQLLLVLQQLQEKIKQQSLLSPPANPGETLQQIEQEKQTKKTPSEKQKQLEILQQLQQQIQTGSTTLKEQDPAEQTKQSLQTEVEKKYQKLLDAGIFSNPDTPSLSMAPNYDTLRTANDAAQTVASSTGAGASASLGAGTAASAGMSAGAIAATAAAVAAGATAAAAVSSSDTNNITLSNAAAIKAANAADVYGVVTPRSSWPTSLNATFNGRLNGTLSDNSAVGANLSMNVNFATINSGSPITGNVLFDNNKGSAALSLVQSGGFVGGGMNGTYNGQAMTGFIRNGQFYGPAADAVKGSWDMTTSSISGGGTFAATR